MQTRYDFDILIIGGGLAGLALATALRKTSCSIAVIEGRAPVRPAGWDSRIYAISPANARFLAASGIWGHLDPARLQAVETMEIHGDGNGRLRFSASDSGIDELAWIIESSLLRCELHETAKRQGNVTLLCPAQPAMLDIDAAAARLHLADGRRLQAGLIVAADGADSWTRAAAGIAVDFHAYGQHGVVANFHCEKPHHGAACQWFRADGVLAFLPLPDGLMSMVWSTSDDHARELLALSPADLCTRVATAGEERFGRLEAITPAAAFPLRLMRAPQTVAPRLALIGDAAHTIHPLSGHGINLGFQDAKVLAETLAAKPAHIDWGDVQWLRRHERSRREEVVALQSLTHGLHTLFSATTAPLAVLRNAGMNLTGCLPVVRDALVRYAIG